MTSSIVRMQQIASKPGHPGMLPVSHATVWRWVKNGKFPRPFKLSPGVTVWRLSEVEAFVCQRKEPEVVA